METGYDEFGILIEISVAGKGEYLSALCSTKRK